MKKQIRRNATKKIEGILNAVKEVEYFVSENNYKGGKVVQGFEEPTSHVFENIREGYAILFENEDGTYTIRMAGRCRWELSL